MRRLNLPSITAVVLGVIFLKASKGLSGGKSLQSGIEPLPNCTETGDGTTTPCVCNTTQCREKAAFIQNILNESINPCENFYDYVCQKWKAQHPIPEGKSRYGAYPKLREKVHREISGILGNETNDDKSQGPQIRRKLQSIYKSCMAECNESVELSGLRAVLQDIGIRNWPLFSSNESVPEWESTLANLVSELNLKPIFEISVAQDLKNVTQYVIQLDQVSLGAVGRNQLLNQTNERNANLTRAYKEYIKEATKLVAGRDIENADLETFADEVVKLETQLANRTTPQGARRNILARYKKTTVQQLQKEVPQMEWVEFFNKLFLDVNITIEEQDSVVIWETEYYNSTLDYLKTVNKSFLHDYFGLRVALALGPYTGDTFMNLTLKFNSMVSGVTKKPEQWERCIIDLRMYADHALGRIYVEKMFEGHAKDEMDAMVSELLDTLRTFIAEKEWMDNNTKTQALNKVDKIGRKIGYPDWLMNDTYLDEMYRYVRDVDEGTAYVKVLANLKENKAKEEHGYLRQPYNKTARWQLGAAVVNAYYSTGSNDISFPAGILQAPFFQYGLPLSLNMGAIGVTIGHEVTHAFDDQGSQYNAEGELHNWWSNDTRNNFTARAKCFVYQYGNITDSETSLKLNGVNTQGENIADNGGLRAAFITYKRLLNETYKSKASLLPGLNFTSDQLFFISDAIRRCESIHPSALRKAIEYGPHSPNKYRITVPMSNLPQFAEAFSCAAGTNMNRTEKCKVW